MFHQAAAASHAFREGSFGGTCSAWIVIPPTGGASGLLVAGHSQQNI